MYDKSSDEEERHAKKRKKRRIEKPPRTAKKTQHSISGLVLPIAGDKTVASEAFAKLIHQDKALVADKVNRKTKKVLQSPR